MASRLAYVNRATDSATTITASSAVTNRPASFLKSAARWKLWRSATGTGDQNVIFDFGTSRTIKIVAIVNYKRHTGGAIRADYWDGSAYQTFGTYTIPASNPTKVLAVYNTAGVNTSRVRIYFTNTGAVSEYVELGVCVAADYYEPTRAIDAEFRMRLIDPSEARQAIDGQEEVQTRTPYRVAEGVFKSNAESDLTGFRTLLDTIGRRTPLVFAPEHSFVDEVLYGRLEGELDYPHLVNRDLWQMPVRVMELR